MVAIGIYLRVLYVLQLDDDILWLVKEDKLGKALQNLSLKTRERASKKEEAMKTLYVYADFDWIEETELVGELGYESLRSSDCYCFTLNDGCFEKKTEICF